MREERYLRLVVRWLVVILLLKLAGYFTLSENVAVTRLVKILLRTGMTFAIFAVYRSLVSRGNLPVIRLHAVLVPAFYLLYLGLGFISLYWSSDPAYSALQLVMTAESLVFAYYFVLVYRLIRLYHPDFGLRLSFILSRSIAIVMVVFLAGAACFPDQFNRLTHGGEESRLGGYLMNPNELGMLAVAGVAMCCIELLHGKSLRLNFLLLLAALAVLVQTGSRSSLVGCFFVLAYFVVQSRNGKIRVAAFGALLLALPFAVSTIFFKQGDVEEVMSMTGRIPFWTALLTEGLPREPLLGFGFMRIAYGDAFQSVHTYAGQMTHNTFIQVLMNLGLVGLTIVLIQLTLTVAVFLRSRQPETKRFFIALFLPILVNSFTEFGIFGESNFGILFYQLLIALAALGLSDRLTPRERIILAARTGRERALRRDS